MTTVLLVEDEESLRELIEYTLESRGYKVITAAGAAEALEISAADRDEKLDLLLTDFVLPGLTGSELAEIISKRRSEIKVLLMSGIITDPIRGTSRHPFIQKPFELSELLRRLDSVLNNVS